MSDVFQINAIQSEIGYNFGDTEILRTAFTHSSAATAEHPSNEGLIFLGKAVGELLIRDHLYSNFDFSEITELNRKLFSEDDSHLSWVSNCGNDLKLNGYVIIADSAKAIKNSRALGNELFLAVTAAIYKDGGMPAVRAFLIPKLKAVIASEAPEFSAISPRRNASARRSAHVASTEHTEQITSVSKNASASTRSAASAIKSLFSSKKRRSADGKIAEIGSDQALMSDSVKKRSEPIYDASTSVRFSNGLNTSRSNRALPKKNKTQEASSTSTAPAENGNYKSALQEYIQKSIRSSSVMLVYNDTKNSSGEFECEIRLFDKVLSRAAGASKKEASQNAARMALNAISTPSGKCFEWFGALSKSGAELSSTHAAAEQTDYVSRLNQHFQKCGHSSSVPLKYEKIENSGNGFAISVSMNGKELGRGEGKTVKAAKQNAAKAALEALSVTV